MKFNFNNIRKMISAFAGLSIVTVAGVSTVACGPTAGAKMNSTVLKDLGLSSDGTDSLLTVSFDGEGDALDWKDSITDSITLSEITAANLLNEGKAKSQESFDFLTNTLKLIPTGDGNWDAKTFNSAEADKITLTIVEHDVTLVENEAKDDYAVQKGTVSVEWKNGETSLGKYAIDIKPMLEKGIVDDHIVVQSVDLKSVTGFEEGKPVIGFQKTNTISQGIEWDLDSQKVKKLKKLSTLTDLPISLYVEDNENTSGMFPKGATIKFSAALGQITGTEPLILTLSS